VNDQVASEKRTGGQSTLLVGTVNMASQAEESCLVDRVSSLRDIIAATAMFGERALPMAIIR
jgi:hypothetical protein